MNDCTRATPVTNSATPTTLSQFWAENSDVCVIRRVPLQDKPKMIEFTIRGAPVPFQRPGFAKHHYYNPRAGEKQCFQKVIRDVVDGVIINKEEKEELFFDDDENLFISATVALRRPLNHFIGRNRRNGLKDESKLQACCTRGDIDNYVKFILDGLEGCIFKNDRVVSKLAAERKWDDDGLCLGYTNISINTLY
jgi:Holliday junction resolvase RusA-like endonuclease